MNFLYYIKINSYVELCTIIYLFCIFGSVITFVICSTAVVGCASGGLDVVDPLQTMGRRSLNNAENFDIIYKYVYVKLTILKIEYYLLTIFS